jgi:hypothetical protein
MKSVNNTRGKLFFQKEVLWIKWEWDWVIDPKPVEELEQDEHTEL